MNRLQKVIIASAAAVVLIIVICTVVVVKVVTDQARQAEYLSCMASYGFTPSTVDTEAELTDAIEVSEICSHGAGSVVDWASYPTPIRAEIGAMERSGDCPGLFARYGRSGSTHG